MTGRAAAERVRTASPSRAHGNPPPPPTSGAARFLPLPGLGFSGLSSSQLPGACDPAATRRRFAVQALRLYSRPRRSRCFLLLGSSCSLLLAVHPRLQRLAPAPPLRPAPRHTPISARDSAPRARAAPSASTSLRAGEQGPGTVLGAYRPYPQSPPPPPSPPPPARGCPRRPDGGRSPLRSSTSARLGLVRLRGVSRALLGMEVGTQGEVEDKFWPPGNLACYLLSLRPCVFRTH